MKKKTIALFLALTLGLCPAAASQAELLSDGDLLTSEEAPVYEEPEYAEEELPEEEEYISESEEFRIEEALPEADLLWDGVAEAEPEEDSVSDEEAGTVEKEPEEDSDMDMAGESARWVYKDGVFTYYDENGEEVPVSELTESVKQYGYFEINGAYYALDKNGKPRTGLVYLNKIPYYFQPDTFPAGQMFMAGWQKFDLPKGEKWIFFKAKSAGDADKGKGEVPGVVRLARIPRIHKTLKCVLDHNNYIKKNAMVTINGKTYITDSEGKVYKNRLVKRGSYRYYVGSDGAMLTNTWTPDGYWVNEEGEWDSSVPRQGSSSAGGTISSIPDGYYNSVGIGGDTQNYRVDCWVNYSGGSKQINFGHYEPTGSSYSFYDKNNPNGDTLDLYMENGTIYGRSTKSGHKSYKVEFDGTYLKIHWEYTTWNHNSKLIKVKLQNIAGGAVG